MARLSRPVTTDSEPLLVVTAPLAPPRGAAIDLARVDDDTAVVIYDPEQFDKPQALFLLAQTLGRPLLDLDTGEVTR